jgi:hypothetical protein
LKEKGDAGDAIDPITFGDSLMSNITLSVDGQSVCFSLEDLRNLETVVLEAARLPGQKAFCSTASGPMTAIIELSAARSGASRAAQPSGQHHFGESGDSAIQLTNY